MNTKTRKPCKRRFWLWLLVVSMIALLVRGRSSAGKQPLSGLRWLALKFSRAWNLRVHWTELPYVLALFNFIGVRDLLREENLVDTQTLPTVDPDVDRPPDPSYLHARSPDGVYNDLTVPEMGSTGTRFGRNVPLIYTYPDEAKLLTPNPRTVSLELLTRDEFQPATILNTLAAAWLQFMVHDWLSHGKNDASRLIEVPLSDDDPWHEHPMRVPRTMLDPTHTPADRGMPPTYINTETHWWDGSQLYGSSREVQDRVRSGADGMLTLTDDGHLPVDPTTGLEITGVNGNWWLGLSVMHTLFARA